MHRIQYKYGIVIQANSQQKHHADHFHENEMEYY